MRKQQYKHLIKKNYLFYNLKSIVALLYKRSYATKTNFYISKNEYRKFMRYGYLSDNLKTIIYFYFNHGIQKHKDAEKYKSLPLPTFGNVTATDLKTKKPKLLDKLQWFINPELRFSIQFKKSRKPFIVVSTTNGIYWVRLKIGTFRKLQKFSYPDYIIAEIKQELQTLLNNQLSQIRKSNKIKTL